MPTNNPHTTALAMQMYLGDFHAYPPTAGMGIMGFGEQYGWLMEDDWRMLLVPFLGVKADRFTEREDPMRVLRCPQKVSNEDGKRGEGQYAMNASGTAPFSTSLNLGIGGSGEGWGRRAIKESRRPHPRGPDRRRRHPARPDDGRHVLDVGALRSVLDECRPLAWCEPRRGGGEPALRRRPCGIGPADELAVHCHAPLLEQRRPAAPGDVGAGVNSNGATPSTARCESPSLTPWDGSRMRCVGRSRSRLCEFE